MFERGDTYFQSLSDKYEVIQQVAETGHAQVFLVKHKRLEVLRIAKVVLKEYADYERILREANLIKDIKHTGIPLIYDIEEDSDSICIIEEYIAGKSLADYMLFSKELDISEIVRLGAQICRVLEVLHTFFGICHMDIKPAHIIIREDAPDEESGIVIIDFDSAVRIGQEPGAEYGTLGYAAPEQYQKVLCGYQHNILANEQSDIYSMGMLLLYMANNGPVQSVADCMEKICSQHSKTIGPIVEKCIRHNPSQRYQSISALREELLSLTKIQQVIKEKTSFDESYDIYVSGTKPGVGVTHFCLCLSVFLAERKKRVVCIRHGDHQDLIAEAQKGELTADGTYYLNGIFLLPEYNGNICCEVSSYHYRVHDCGVKKLDQNQPEEVQKRQRSVRILIGDYGYRKDDLLIMEHELPETVIFINHISGRKFYQFLRKDKREHQYYRIPYIYDWYALNPMFEAVVSEALQPVLPVKETGTGRWKQMQKKIKRRMKGAAIEKKV